MERYRWYHRLLDYLIAGSIFAGIGIAAIAALFIVISAIAFPVYKASPYDDCYSYVEYMTTSEYNMETCEIKQHRIDNGVHYEKD